MLRCCGLRHSARAIHSGRTVTVVMSSVGVSLASTISAGSPVSADTHWLQMQRVCHGHVSSVGTGSLWDSGCLRVPSVCVAS
jgi:hypothetical protein